MRSYGQYCALAKALDIVGDRWTLLIVRELLIRRACRYTDLREGLPGIATNLLVDRLRDMEDSGLLFREDAPPPIATTLFRLTPRGEELETVLYQLGLWGAPLLANASKKDAFQAHWLVLPARHWLRDHAPDQSPVRIEIRAGGETMAIETANGTVEIRLGTVEHPDLVLLGTPRLIASLLTGKIDLAHAQTAGLRYTGDPGALRRVQPLALK
jgi:DNA-binding HxlR family transcriptional regulator